ncbi:UNVERIFIED_CONTAM: hypothetical protein GTU68_029351 [Idotea baltica]|nr:hypothetical protein [Idotea baltica]
MYIFRKVEDIQGRLNAWRKQGKRVGFVPTLGALHDGHLSLLKQARAQNEIVVCSIFVNPTQFNEASDLKKYPRTIEADIRVLLNGEVDVLLYPQVEEIYPPGIDTRVDIDLGAVAEVMEAEQRPGHFDGVMQVVKRLLDIVKPDRLYMGQKDFQQFTIVQHMIDYFKMPTELVVCPIKREAHGLAMSSRNERLSADTRAAARLIYDTLLSCKGAWGTKSIVELQRQALCALSVSPFKPEYFEIVDGYTLQPIDPEQPSDYVVACTAVWADNVRLIDNIIF